MTSSQFDFLILESINNAIKTVKAAPLNLGGYTGASGGGGGPTGGYNGVLPQRKVAYDTTEAANSGTPASGRSLLHNLNHIRYRIQTLENADVGSPVSIYEDGSLVASGVTIIDFTTSMNVVNLGGGHVQVASTASGTTSSGSTHSHIYNEDLSDQIPGSGYTTINVFSSGTLRLYYNGLRQRGIYFVEGGDLQSFTVTFTTYSGDSIMVDYDIQASGSSGWGEFGWGG